MDNNNNINLDDNDVDLPSLDGAVNLFSRSRTNSNNSGHQRNYQTHWIFAYGSLCWYPGFEYEKCVTGYIRGYVRRFWQGNIEHRGTKDKPGRVATLVEETEGLTWGCAYKVIGDAALEYLNERECTLGGYMTQHAKFYPRVSNPASEITGEAFPVLTYIATKANSDWLGESKVATMAEQIVETAGKSGFNAEYIIRLANFMRDELPTAIDDHLFELERAIIEMLKKRGICITSVMSDRRIERIRRDSHDNVGRPTSFEFTSRVPEKKLRCLHI